MKSLLIIFTALILVGCGEQKIDGSSMEAYTKSIQAMKKGMNMDKKEEFERYLKLIALKDTKLIEMVDTEGFKRSTMDRLNGMTYKQIMAKGKFMASIIAEKKREALEDKKVALCEKWQQEILDKNEYIKTRSEKYAKYKDNESVYNEVFKPLEDMQMVVDDLEKSYDKHCMY